jgi:type III pantothenate kinase
MFWPRILYYRERLMLIVVDIGNTHTAFGLFDGDNLRFDWRVETRSERTADEHAAALYGLFELEKLDMAKVDAAIISSVVPPATLPMERLFARYFKLTPLVVGPGMKTGMPVLYENPRDLGADRIVNAVAAYARWPQGAIVVDFGTATTLDVVTARGEYAGGVITPGLLISADALYRATAKLPRVEIARPKAVVGTNTVASIQSGLVFGYAGMIDALVKRIRSEVAYTPRVIATGGLGALVARESVTIEEYDELLTLRGLKILHDRNRAA